MPESKRKWLNIVFDLNGVLCHTALKSYAAKYKSFNVEDHVLCHRNPTVIGPKVVFARPNLGEFLQHVGMIAKRVVVWTTMLKRNAKPIVDHLFHGCAHPYDILGQEQCTKIEISEGKYFHQGGKVHCMKVLSEALFTNYSGDDSFTANNTLLIDDSPSKSVCNENGNAIFLDTWSPINRRDDVLKGELLPWLRHLHLNCRNGELRDYVQKNRFGVNPFTARDLSMRQIEDAMRVSNKALGARYELPGIGLVIGRGRRRK